jgi:carboxyl-terminal processing protease
MKLHSILALVIAIPLISIGVIDATSPQPQARYAKIVKSLAHELPREHLSRHQLDDSISALTLENYLSALDYERIYFLQSDVETFKRKETLLDDEIRVGNVDFAYEVFDVYLQRVRDRVAYTKTLLENDFDLTIQEEYRWKRKDAPWHEHEEIQNDYWRKRIKNEYIRRLVSDELAAAEAEKVATNITEAVETIDESATEDETSEALPEDDEIIPVEKLAPKAFILERYEQYLTTLEDSDSEWVLQKYLSAFAKSYDPHCDYMSPATEEDFDIEMKLSLFGIGAMLRPEDGTAKIVSLVPGGPADRDESKTHLRPGDKIIAVAQDTEKSVSILHWPLYKSVRLIRGEKGTRVVLTVIPATDPTETTTKTVALIRDEVKLEDRAAKSTLKAVTDSRGTDYNLGVIELPGFYADLKGKRTKKDYKSSSRDVSTILREMREADVDGIILDLRNNGGGSLLESILMTGLFIKEGPTVQVRERHVVSILPDNDPSIAYSGPLVVLVNRLSASASEILAAALQDYGRAVIVGDSKTHGKGSVQTVLRLSRNGTMGSIKVTNALFYRISGGSTQLRGVIPDIIVPSAFDYMEFGEDFLSNPMEWSTVRAAIYSPFAELDSTIATLAEQSQARKISDERLIAYHKLLGRIEALNARETLSLNLEERKTQAQTEQELLDIQNDLMEQGAEEGEEDESHDVVEDEALNILADLIYIQTQQKKALANTGAPPHSAAASTIDN